MNRTTGAIGPLYKLYLETDEEVQQGRMPPVGTIRSYLDGREYIFSEVSGSFSPGNILGRTQQNLSLVTASAGSGSNVISLAGFIPTLSLSSYIGMTLTIRTSNSTNGVFSSDIVKMQYVGSTLFVTLSDAVPFTVTSSMTIDIPMQSILSLFLEDNALNARDMPVGVSIVSSDSSNIRKWCWVQTKGVGFVALEALPEGGSISRGYPVSTADEGRCTAWTSDNYLQGQIVGYALNNISEAVPEDFPVQIYLTM